MVKGASGTHGGFALQQQLCDQRGWRGWFPFSRRSPLLQQNSAPLPIPMPKASQPAAFNDAHWRFIALRDLCLFSTIRR